MKPWKALTVNLTIHHPGPTNLPKLRQLWPQSIPNPGPATFFDPHFATFFGVIPITLRSQCPFVGPGAGTSKYHGIFVIFPPWLSTSVKSVQIGLKTEWSMTSSCMSAQSFRLNACEWKKYPHNTPFLGYPQTIVFPSHLWSSSWCCSRAQVHGLPRRSANPWRIQQSWDSWIHRGHTQRIFMYSYF